MTTKKKHIDVVVAIIECKEKGILIAKRQSGQHLSGYWEFPGGKVEAGEMLEHALAREVLEELGLTVSHPNFIEQIDYEYPEKLVSLHVYKVEHFSGVASGREGQEVRWVQKDALREYSFPPANEPLLDAI